MAHAERIEVAHDGPVTTVVINRPAARNACSVDMIRALHTAFRAFEEDAAARVAVLTGVGSRSAPAPTSGRSRTAPPSGSAGPGPTRASPAATSPNR